MRSGFLDLDLDLDLDPDLKGENRRCGGLSWLLPLLLAPRLRECALPLRSRWDLAAPSSIEGRRREDWERDLRRPRSPGLKELMRRRVLRSYSPSLSDERESMDSDRRLRF